MASKWLKNQNRSGKDIWTDGSATVIILFPETKKKLFNKC